jgi:hypothetical protein
MLFGSNNNSCFTYHIALHSLFGFGLGLIAVTLLPSLQNVWYGLALVGIVLIADAVSKSKKG